MNKFGKTDLFPLSYVTIMPIHNPGEWRLSDLFLGLHYSQHQTHGKYCTNEWKMIKEWCPRHLFQNKSSYAYKIKWIYHNVFKGPSTILSVVFKTSKGLKHLLFLTQNISVFNLTVKYVIQMTGITISYPLCLNVMLVAKTNTDDQNIRITSLSAVILPSGPGMNEWWVIYWHR